MALNVKRINEIQLTPDPLLTELAQRYENADFISTFLLPTTMVRKDTGKIPVYGNENMRIHDSKRALRAPVKEMPIDNFSFKEFKLDNYGLEATMDYKEIEATSDFLDLENYSINTVMQSILLAREYDAVKLVTDSNTYSSSHHIGLTSGDYFNDSASDPLAIIRDGMETVRAKINKKPNVIVLSQSTFNALQAHPKITDLIKHTQIGVVTEDLIATILSTSDNKVTVKVGTGVYEDPATGTNVDLWGDVVVMAYNKQFSRVNSIYDASFGKSLVQNGYPVATRSQDRNGILHYAAVLHSYKNYITQKDAGFLITDTIGEVSGG